MKTHKNKTRLHFLHKVTILFVFTAMTIIGTAPIVHSKPFRLSIIPKNGAAFGCTVCHISPRGGRALNLFGQDYKKIGIKAGEKYTQELGDLDSDNDGFTNDQEFESKTRPGDPKSAPE